ncbi:uncharacterized protein LOC122094267 isoform X1 [Macadamia integrifolia]|uniref:uncharacterized protein LOC122094267 isoform X1 n=1 Tax=Macadamia integrifolia TaxID=60698 RepID=UPI001C5327C6|nr:uncharacterized protein LOC122094267 isoform X1 [Macadamia integrifolia]
MAVTMRLKKNQKNMMMMMMMAMILMMLKMAATATATKKMGRIKSSPGLPLRLHLSRILQLVNESSNNGRDRGTGCSNDDEATSRGSFRRLKDLKRELRRQRRHLSTRSRDSSKSTGLSGEEATAMIVQICKLTKKDYGAVHIVSTDHL